MTPGDRLGPYEILGLIGEGGMGRVYRARDTRLNREVAIKVSAAEFSERFSREASVVASLNHPNICTLHDIGPNFLVMELVEGPSLIDRMAQGPIPLDEAVPIALQIAEALEAAHEKSIVHRDLKPANIKFTAEGKVKVFDFGLAKALDEDLPRANPATSPTLAPTRIAATQTGYIIGTAGYMAPEQARGQAADRRADVWAFGVVLWEMVVGRRMFDGETVGDTLAQVLTQTPDLDAAPQQLRPLLQRCLERDRKKRLQAIGEARIALESPSATAQRETASSPAPTRLPWLIAACLTLALPIALWAPWRAKPPADQPLTSLEVDLGVELPNTYMSGAATLLSPDGRRIVFMDANRHLWTRRLDQDKVTALSNEDSQGPFFAPDSRWLGYFSGGKLKKVMVDGGSPVDICDTAPGYGTRGGAWGEDGTILAAIEPAAGLVRVPFSGGKAFIFTSSDQLERFDKATIEVQTLNGGIRKTLVQGATFGRYLPSGHLVFLSKQTLFAAPFDPDRLQLNGTPVPVLEGVYGSAFVGYSQIDFSRDGKFVYRRTNGLGGIKVQWLDSTGGLTPLLSKQGLYAAPRLSPDGTRLALDVDADIWVYELGRETITRITFNGGAGPVWTPNGKYILFRQQGIWWVRADGGGKVEQLLSEGVPTSFTPDGKTLTYSMPGSVWTVPIEEEASRLVAGKPQQIPGIPASPYAMFSPDGKWIAYSTIESGRSEVYVRAWPDNGAKWQISSVGGRQPVWSRNGRELFWKGFDSLIYGASYRVSGGVFQAEKPRTVASRRLADGGPNSWTVDVHPDGKRFVVLAESVDVKPQSTVTLLFNFFDEIKRKLAQGVE